MKQDILKLSEEKGFETEYLEEIDSSMGYYLWLCELQKWLRDEHKIFIEAEKYNSNKRFQLYICSSGRKQYYDSDGVSVFESYERTLEVGCFEALKLID